MYEITNESLNIHSILFYPIEYLPWDYLRIGNLGEGQIQVRDGKNPPGHYTHKTGRRFNLHKNVRTNFLNELKNKCTTTVIHR